MALAGKTVLVFGATGNIGRAATIGFLNSGAKVIAPVRDAGRVSPKIERFVSESSLSHFSEIVGDISTDEGRAAILAATDEGRSIDHVVSSFGPWWNIGPLSAIAPDAFVKVYEANLFPHFYAWRLLAPALLEKSGASYNVVTGGAGLNPGASGITAICAAGLFALVDGFIVEAKDKPLKVTEVRINMRVSDDDKPEPDTETSSTFSSLFPGIASKEDVHGVQLVVKDTFGKLKA